MLNNRVYCNNWPNFFFEYCWPIGFNYSCRILLQSEFSDGELAYQCRLAVPVPARTCCAAVMATIDRSKDCLCQVVEHGQTEVSVLDIHVIWYL
jgi:hypothetical protein